MTARPPSNRTSLPGLGAAATPPWSTPAKPVERRLLIPLVIVLLLLIGGFAAILVYIEKESLHQTVNQKLLGASHDLMGHLREQARMMSAIEDVLLHDSGLREALKRQDRRALLAAHREVFAELRARHGITHLYFHRPDRVNLLRVHNPERYGDVINRFTARKAERTGKVASGIELGPLGTFTLRVVRPVYDGGTLIGYLELGKEIEDILHDTSGKLGVELIAVIHKNLLHREGWEAGMKMLDREPHWGRFADDVAIYSSLDPLPDEAGRLIGGEDREPDAQVELEIDGKQWRAMGTPLVDASGAEVGTLLVFYDASESAALFKHLFTVVSVVASLLAILLIAFLHVMLRRVDQSIFAREADLAESAAFQRTLIETSPDFIYVMDRDMIVRSVNRLQAGRREEDVIGHCALSFVHPDYRAQLRKAFEQALKEGELKAVEAAVCLPDGEHFFLNRLNPLPVTNEAEAVVLIATDITERKLVEETIRRYSEELESQKEELNAQHQEIVSVNTSLEKAIESADAANRAKSEFLANMSHEIRTPMTAILGFTDNLLDADRPESERLNCVHTVRRNGEYLLELINDILDLSKIEAGKMTLESKGLQPCRIVAEVASLMRVRADAKGLPFNIEYIGAIPETIQSDSTRLRQILINIIGNAIKFTETGAVRLVTRFVDDRDEPALQFDVIDTGRGMTEEEKAKLFQPFMQADNSTTRKFGGTGLGLTISKRFAEMLGGDITVAATEMGIGTTFRATVATGPLDGVRMLDDPMSATTVAPEQAAGMIKNPRGTAQSEACGSSILDCRILLAEDGPDNQRLISFVLKKAGADVTVMENGKLALDAALTARDEGDPFDCILMDMQMPVMDGYEAASRLRRKGYTGPIIALTANAMAGDREKCINAGCDDYATKPVDRQKLIKSIEAHLQIANV